MTTGRLISKGYVTADARIDRLADMIFHEAIHQSGILEEYPTELAQHCCGRDTKGADEKGRQVASATMSEGIDLRDVPSPFAPTRTRAKSPSFVRRTASVAFDQSRPFLQAATSSSPATASSISNPTPLRSYESPAVFSPKNYLLAHNPPEVRYTDTGKIQATLPPTNVKTDIPQFTDTTSFNASKASGQTPSVSPQRVASTLARAKEAISSSSASSAPPQVPTSRMSVQEKRSEAFKLLRANVRRLSQADFMKSSLSQRLSFLGVRYTHSDGSQYGYPNPEDKSLDLNYKMLISNSVRAS
jgi:hypothetical protein